MISGGDGPTSVMVRTEAALAGLSLPAASIANAVTVWRPRLKGAAGTTLHCPASSVTAVPRTLLPSCTRTVASASAVPAIAGRGTLKVPLTAICGAAGGVRSMASSTLAEVGLRLPARSIATTVAVCSPSASPRSTVRLHVPSACAIPAAITTLLTERVTALPASAVPRSVGTTVRNAPGATIVGWAGAVRSIVSVLVTAGPAFPAASVAAILNTTVPSASARVGRREKLPEASA